MSSVLQDKSCILMHRSAILLAAPYSCTLPTSPGSKRVAIGQTGSMIYMTPAKHLIFISSHSSHSQVMQFRLLVPMHSVTFPLKENFNIFRPFQKFQIKYSSLCWIFSSCGDLQPAASSVRPIKRYHESLIWQILHTKIEIFLQYWLTFNNMDYSLFFGFLTVLKTQSINTQVPSGSRAPGNCWAVMNICYICYICYIISGIKLIDWLIGCLFFAFWPQEVNSTIFIDFFIEFTM